MLVEDLRIFDTRFVERDSVLKVTIPGIYRSSGQTKQDYSVGRSREDPHVLKALVFFPRSLNTKPGKLKEILEKVTVLLIYSVLNDSMCVIFANQSILHRAAMRGCVNFEKILRLPRALTYLNAEYGMLLSQLVSCLTCVS